MKKRTTLLAVMLIITTTFFAQTGTIKGIIKDKISGEPIFGATVYIEEGGVKIGAATDPDGKYTIKPVSSGKHVVYSSHVAYSNVKTIDVGVTNDKITYVNVNMNTGGIDIDVFELIEYKIPLISKDEPSVSSILPSELKNSVNSQNPMRMVSDLPGLTMDPSGKGILVRGSRATATQYITDGMKSITNSIGIPGQAVGSIKVYTGGIPAQYGDITGGVIVVETKSYYDLSKQY